MHIRRVVTLAVVVVAVVSAPALAAQQTGGMQERAAQVRDTEVLVALVDAVAAGTQPTPTDVSIEWEANHFFKGAAHSRKVESPSEPRALSRAAAPMISAAVSQEVARQPLTVPKRLDMKPRAAAYASSAA